MALVLEMYTVSLSPVFPFYFHFQLATFYDRTASRPLERSGLLLFFTLFMRGPLIIPRRREQDAGFAAGEYRKREATSAFIRMDLRLLHARMKLQISGGAFKSVKGMKRKEI